MRRLGWSSGQQDGDGQRTVTDSAASGGEQQVAELGLVMLLQGEASINTTTVRVANIRNLLQAQEACWSLVKVLAAFTFPFTVSCRVWLLYCYHSGFGLDTFLRTPT